MVDSGNTLSKSRYITAWPYNDAFFPRYWVRSEEAAIIAMNTWWKKNASRNCHFFSSCNHNHDCSFFWSNSISWKHAIKIQIYYSLTIQWCFGSTILSSISNLCRTQLYHNRDTTCLCDKTWAVKNCNTIAKLSTLIDGEVDVASCTVAYGFSWRRRGKVHPIYVANHMGK